MLNSACDIYTKPIERPIFIIGTGRSGTTLLFNILHQHDELAWPCQYMVNRWLTKRDRFVQKLAQTTVFKGLIREHHYKRRPVPEPYHLWLKYKSGFNRPCRDLRVEDAYEKVITGIRNEVAKQLKNMDKDRFMTKDTGWSRIGFIDAIFSDAHYVNVVRDGRAVAWSLLNTDWWEGWKGPSQWRWGELSEESQEIWERSNRSFFVLAGIQWKTLMENLQENGSKIGQRYIEIRYEDLVTSPEKTFRKVIQWGGLSQFDHFYSKIRSIKFYDHNRKWKTEVGSIEKEYFNNLLGPSLEKFGYSARSDS